MTVQPITVLWVILFGVLFLFLIDMIRRLMGLRHSGEDRQPGKDFARLLGVVVMIGLLGAVHHNFGCGGKPVGHSGLHKKHHSVHVWKGHKTRYVKPDLSGAEVTEDKDGGVASNLEQALAGRMSDLISFEEGEIDTKLFVRDWKDNCNRKLVATKKSDSAKIAKDKCKENVRGKKSSTDDSHNYQNSVLGYVDETGAKPKIRSIDLGSNALMKGEDVPGDLEALCKPVPLAKDKKLKNPLRILVAESSYFSGSGKIAERRHGRILLVQLSGSERSGLKGNVIGAIRLPVLFGVGFVNDQHNGYVHHKGRRQVEAMLCAEQADGSYSVILATRGAHKADGRNRTGSIFSIENLEIKDPAQELKLSDFSAMIDVSGPRPYCSRGTKGEWRDLSSLADNGKGRLIGVSIFEPDEAFNDSCSIIYHTPVRLDWKSNNLITFDPVKRKKRALVVVKNHKVEGLVAGKGGELAVVTDDESAGSFYIGSLK